MQMIKYILPPVVAFAAAAAAGLWAVPFLRKVKAGQQIREDGPTWHMSKAGTPTMGGIIFIIGIAVSCILLGWKDMMQGSYVHLTVLALAVLYGIIGFIDDYTKVKKKRNLGLTGIQKLVLQIVVAAAFLAMLRYSGNLSNEIKIPFTSVGFTLPWVIYLIAAVFVIIGGVNAVNLTDGIDGLATGATMPVALFFALAAVWKGQNDLFIFAASLFGALAAFLIYNFHPAKVFMGDTGSLFLGGAVCAMAFALDVPIILIPVGIVYIIETLSVILQVGYFKLTHGKRIFRMSPFHHHLEMGGWSEKKIFAVFTFISFVGCAIAALGLIPVF